MGRGNLHCRTVYRWTSMGVPGEFLGGPHGIWVDSPGDLYVGEALVNGRLQKFVRQT